MSGFFVGLENLYKMFWQRIHNHVIAVPHLHTIFYIQTITFNSLNVICAYIKFHFSKKINEHFVSDKTGKMIFVGIINPPHEQNLYEDYVTINDSTSQKKNICINTNITN